MRVSTGWWLMGQRPEFLFVTCQVGAERAVKFELAGRWPRFRPAFSRPGMLTFKLPPDDRLVADFDLRSVFARAYGFSLGVVSGSDMVRLARAAWALYGGRPCRRIHVWPRDTAPPGDGGYEPGMTREAREAWGALHACCPRPGELAPDADAPDRPGRKGEFVLDCILVEPGQWCVGYHRVRDVSSQWPGGLIPLEPPPHAVSRAWLKMEEALHWSGFPITAGARCAELGSAPGGSTQALLDRGCEVMGIDPAEMHPAVLAHPCFTHVRARVRQVRRRLFRRVRWLVADMNVAPRCTLDALEDIVTHPEVNVRGIIAMLKLSQWAVAENLDRYLARVRSWGFNVVRARQLRYNRQEICFAALKRPFVRRRYRWT